MIVCTLAVHAAVLLPSRPQPTRRAAPAQSLVCGSVDARCSCARCALAAVARIVEWPPARDAARGAALAPDGEFVGQPVTDAAIASLRWYKRTISPLLLPGCRFVPTCSEYAVQSFQRFSPPQAAVLTAWRLVRCNPTGGQGVDEPVWPPPAYNGGSGVVRTALDDAESRAKAAGSAAAPASSLSTRRSRSLSIGATRRGVELPSLERSPSGSLARAAFDACRGVLLLEILTEPRIGTKRIERPRHVRRRIRAALRAQAPVRSRAVGLRAANFGALLGAAPSSASRRLRVRCLELCARRRRGAPPSTRRVGRRCRRAQVAAPRTRGGHVCLGGTMASAAASTPLPVPPVAFFRGDVVRRRFMGRFALRVANARLDDAHGRSRALRPRGGVAATSTRPRGGRHGLASGDRSRRRKLRAPSSRSSTCARRDAAGQPTARGRIALAVQSRSRRPSAAVRVRVARRSPRHPLVCELRGALAAKMRRMMPSAQSREAAARTTTTARDCARHELRRLPLRVDLPAVGRRDRRCAGHAAISRRGGDARRRFRSLDRSAYAVPSPR